jgi:endonuclease YncB( thermonuclease family)
MTLFRSFIVVCAGLAVLLVGLMILGLALAAQKSFGESGDFVRGQQVRVIDGDTVEWPSGERVRLWSIDAPEIGRSRCPHERQLGMQARDRLRALLDEGKVLLVRCEPKSGRCHDRHGRTLGAIMSERGDLSAILVRESLAVPYRRGVKFSFCESL